MSLLGEIKYFLKRYLKNPILVAAAAYLIYRYLSKYLKKESFVEKIKVIRDEDTEEHSIIQDVDTGKFILIRGVNVWSADTREELEDFVKTL